MAEPVVEKVTEIHIPEVGAIDFFTCEATRPDGVTYRHSGEFRHMGEGKWHRQPLWGWDWMR